MVKPNAEVRMALHRLAPSPFNNRKIQDGEANGGLCASVKERGVLTPLLVRKNGKGYEILAGSRRFAAAKMAGLKDVPVRILDVDDDEAREIVIVENLQRKDVHPLDEADGFRDLLDKSNGDVNGVVAKVNKPRRYVVQHAKLGDLSMKWREVWLEGKKPMTVQHAFILCRLPEKVQDQILSECKQYFPDAERLLDDINRRVHADLKEAPFDLKDKDLVGGACEACPKRAGSNQDLFEGITKDTCTDAICFTKKLSEWIQSTKAKLEKDGKAVRLVSHNGQYSRGKKDLPKGTLLEEKWKGVSDAKTCSGLATGILVDRDLPWDKKKSNRTFLVCIGGDKCSVHKNVNEYSNASVPKKVAAAARKKTIEKNKKLRRALEERHMTFTHVLRKWKTNVEDMRSIASEVWSRLWSDNQAILAQRRGWIEKKSKIGYGGHFNFDKDVLPSMSEKSVLAFLLECTYVGDVSDSRRFGSSISPLAKRLKVDHVLVKNEVDRNEAAREKVRKLRRETAAADRKREKAKKKAKAPTPPAKKKKK